MESLNFTRVKIHNKNEICPSIIDLWRTQIKNQGFEAQIGFEIILKKCFHLLIGCGGYLNMGLLGLDLLILVLGIFDKFLGI